MAMRKLFVINSLSGGLQIVVGALLTLATVPIFIHKMGAEQYGVFSLITVVSSLGLFTNLGFNYSLIKYIAEQGKTIESNYDIVTVFIILLGVLIPSVFCAIYFNDFVLRNILHITAIHINEDTRGLFNFFAVSVLFVVLGQVPIAMLDSQQKVYVSNVAQVIYSFASKASTLLIVFLSTTLKLVGVAFFLSTLLWFAILMTSAIRTWRSFDVHDYFANFPRIAKKHFLYGSKIYMTGIMGFFYEPITKILISRYIGLTEVGFFDISLKVKALLWSVPERLLYPILPLLAQLKEKEKIRMIVHDVSQKLFFFVLPLSVTVIFLSQPIIFLWIGSNVAIIALSTTLVVVGFLFVLPVLPIYQFLTVKNYPGKTTLIQASNALFTFSLFFLLVPHFGYLGAVISYTTAVVISFGICLFFQYKYLDSLIFDSLSQIIKLVEITIVLLFIDLIIDFTVGNLPGKVVCIGFANVVSSILMFKLLRVFVQSDIDKYVGQNIGVKRVLSKVLIRW
jgi:O-antigen/teichoic acid export membrane protein